MDPARKAKLGERWVCFSCAAKFYDLKKPEPICPKCETDQRESPVFKQKKGRKRAKKATKKATKAATVAKEVEETEPPPVESPDDSEGLDMEEMEIDDDDPPAVEVSES